MSLILDALRKLERERERPDPEVVVVGSLPWHGVRTPRRAPLLAALLAVLAVLVVAGVWLGRRLPQAPATLRSAPAAAPVPAPLATARPVAETPATLPPPSARVLKLPATPVPGPSAVERVAPASRAGEPAPPAAGGLQLMAISMRDGRPIAIVSNHLVREGDSFDGVRILRIGQTEVEVEDHGRRRILQF